MKIQHKSFTLVDDLMLFLNSTNPDEWQIVYNSTWEHYDLFWRMKDGSRNT